MTAHLPAASRSRRSARPASAIALALLCALALTPVAAAAQCRTGCLLPATEASYASPRDDRLSGHLTALSVNTLLGALTGGVRRHAGGGSFWRGFAEGAGGGSAIYAGKVLSAESFWGAGLAGRQVAAVGASVVRNTSEGKAPLAELMLPLGPVRAYVRSDALDDPRFRLDVPGTVVSLYRAFAADSRFDGAASLSAGTPVFTTGLARRAGWQGNNTAGVILLLDRTGGTARPLPNPERVFAHERIHLLQYDQAQHTWSAPIEGWLLRRVPGGAWIERNLDLGLIMLPLALLNQIIPYDDRPWEVEAHFFSEDRRLISSPPTNRLAGSGTDSR